MTTWERFREVRMMLPGWMEGDGESLTPAARRWGHDFLKACDEQGVPFPHIFLTHDGGLTFEDQPADVRWCLEVHLDGTNDLCTAGGSSWPPSFSYSLLVAEAVESLAAFRRMFPIASP